MKYMGSKARHAKEILPIILKDRKPNQYYVEPFCGGCNLIDKVSNPRMGNDIHPHLIYLFKAVQNGWVPPANVSENLYKEKSLYKTLDELTAFIGFGCSYSGKWFGGYARGNTNNGLARNYADESARNLINQAPNLVGIEFYNKNYWELEIPENSIIYCDPPYAGTTNYSTGGFDHDRFWKWCLDQYEKGHIIFVSEYSAPDDWTCVWEKKVNNTLVKNTGSKQGVEKLFTIGV